MYNWVNYEIYMFFKNCLALMGVPGIMGTYLLDVININYGQPQVVANEVTWLIEWWGNEWMEEASIIMCF
jgi:hypothetical protein